MPHQFAVGSLWVATMWEGQSPILKESSETATKRAIVALEIQRILDERSAVVSEDGRLPFPLRLCNADVPMAIYLSALHAFCLVIFSNR